MAVILVDGCSYKSSLFLFVAGSALLNLFDDDGCGGCLREATTVHGDVVHLKSYTFSR